VTQWCFAAMNTVEPPLFQIAWIDFFGGKRVRVVLPDHSAEVTGGWRIASPAMEFPTYVSGTSDRRNER
jgi:hypothetical protein